MAFAKNHNWVLVGQLFPPAASVQSFERYESDTAQLRTEAGTRIKLCKTKLLRYQNVKTGFNQSINQSIRIGMFRIAWMLGAHCALLEVTVRVPFCLLLYCALHYVLLTTASTVLSTSNTVLYINQYHELYCSPTRIVSRVSIPFYTAEDP